MTLKAKEIEMEKEITMVMMTILKGEPITTQNAIKKERSQKAHDVFF